MFKLYLVLCVLRIVAFYYLVWTVAHTSATYLVEKKEIEKFYADEQANDESFSKLDYEKNFTQKHYKIDPDRKSHF